MPTGKKPSLLENVFLLYIPLTAFLSFVIFPFFWTIVTSFKVESDIVKIPVKYLPNPATFHNYVVAWKNVGFSIFFKNSVVISSISVVFIVMCSVLVGYALSRFDFKGKQAFMIVLLCTQFIPGAMMIIPLFITFKNIGLINNMFSLVIVNATFLLPFNSILMRGFISSIPIQLEEAAMIDGCGRLKAIQSIILPILMPGIVATSAFAFVGCWNEFLFAFMFINKKSLFTLPVGLKYMIGEYTINYGALAAGSIIALIPAVLIFAYMQKFLIGGLSAGGVKG